jgi:hypothetical protein
MLSVRLKFGQIYAGTARLDRRMRMLCSVSGGRNGTPQNMTGPSLPTAHCGLSGIDPNGRKAKWLPGTLDTLMGRGRPHTTAPHFRGLAVNDAIEKSEGATYHHCG